MKVIVTDCITGESCVAEVATAMTTKGIPIKHTPPQKTDKFFTNAAVRVETTGTMIIYIVPHDFNAVYNLVSSFTYEDKPVYLREAGVTAFVNPDEDAVEKIKDLQEKLGIKRGMLCNK